jgi:hypothetical protein
MVMVLLLLMMMMMVAILLLVVVVFPGRTRVSSQICFKSSLQQAELVLEKATQSQAGRNKFFKTQPT